LDQRAARYFAIVKLQGTIGEDLVILVTFSGE
jgi:hypothetical protein